MTVVLQQPFSRLVLQVPLPPCKPPPMAVSQYQLVAAVSWKVRIAKLAFSTVKVKFEGFTLPLASCAVQPRPVPFVNEFCAPGLPNERWNTCRTVNGRLVRMKLTAWC